MNSETKNCIEILLVEDNPADVLLMEEAMHDAGSCNKLHVVNDGEEAMAYLRGQGVYAAAPRPDLVMLDLNLPKKDGREVLKEIKEDSGLMHIPVIIISTSQSEEEILNSYRLHANCFISKPVDLNKFIAIVQAIDDFWFSVARLPSKACQS
ncbi:MAG: response regulator [Deltaproteobacteria bacterium]|nr:response regulator [Deltaproteobacteria bacterium]